MYKLVVMIKDSADDELIRTFRESVLIHLEKAAGQNLRIGKIDGAKLNEDPYYKICEFEFPSKLEMDKALASNDGKKFNRNLTSFFQHVSIFFIDYGE